MEVLADLDATLDVRVDLLKHLLYVVGQVIELCRFCERGRAL
jgi:hypothetical protein